MQDYKNWESQVFEHLQKLKSEIDTNEKAKALYNGFKVWFSPIKRNPKVLFIGINPGDGNPFNDGSIDIQPQAHMSYLEYLNGENPTYTLARETIKAFKKAGYSEDEIRTLLNKDSVKTNFYYIITRGDKHMKMCLDNLSKKRFWDFFGKSYEWTKNLIDIINPKVIICEGKNVFTDVTEMFTGKASKLKDGCGVIKVNEEDLTILGYSRRRSNIRNLPLFAELIENNIPKNS